MNIIADKLNKNKKFSSKKKDDASSTTSLFIVKNLMFWSTFMNAGWSKYSDLYFIELGWKITHIGYARVLGSFSKVFARFMWGWIFDSVADKNKPKVLLSSIVMSLASLSLFQSKLAFKSIPIFFLCRSLRSISNSMLSILDSIILKVIKQAKEGYGKQRVWGSIGWGLGALISGFVIEQFGFTGMFFWCYVNGMIVCIIILNFSSSIVIQQNEPNERSTSTFKFSQVLEFLKNPQILKISIFFFFMQLSFRINEDLLHIYCKSIGISTKIMGIATLVCTFSDYPIFWYSDYLIQQFGYRNIIQFGCIGFAIRLFGYTFITGPGFFSIILLLSLQILHGISYSGIWICYIQLFGELSADNIKGMSTSTLHIIGLSGQVLSSLIWPRIFEFKGFRLLCHIGVFIMVVIGMCIQIDRNLFKSQIIQDDFRTMLPEEKEKFIDNDFRAILTETEKLQIIQDDFRIMLPEEKEKFIDDNFRAILTETKKLTDDELNSGLDHFSNFHLMMNSTIITSTAIDTTSCFSLNNVPVLTRAHLILV